MQLSPIVHDSHYMQTPTCTCPLVSFCYALVRNKPSFQDICVPNLHAKLKQNFENGAWILQHQSAVFLLPCIALWVNVTQILSADGHIKKVKLDEAARVFILAWNLPSRMFSTKCLSPGFSRFLSATTTHVAQSLKGNPAVVLPVVDTVVQSPPATLTNHSLAKIVPTGNLVATTKHFGKNRFSFFCVWNCK